MKSWREILALAAKFLERRGVPDPAVAAELLAARLLKCTRGFLSPRLDEIPDDRHLAAMRRGMTRLADGEPIQYVLGEWDFRSLTLTCDKRALIPRPETEELVTRVLAFLEIRQRELPHERPLVVDVGTGSGCIALSLAKEQEKCDFLGIDISEAAISLARENAIRTQLSERVKFVVADGLDDFDEPDTFDAIVSNPPYVPSSECEKLDPRILKWEPRNALDGGPTGLDFYERLATDAFNLLKPGGGIFFEIGHDQGNPVRALLAEMEFSGIRIEQDFAGHDRYALAIRS